MHNPNRVEPNKLDIWEPKLAIGLWVIEIELV
jgi:hypothetical protein